MYIEKPLDIQSVADHIIDIEIDMPYASSNNFTSAVVPGYEANKAFLTTATIDKLQLIQTELKSKDLGLKILDAYRPDRSVKYFSNDWKIADTDLKTKNRFFPKLKKSDLFEIGYIATKSSHSGASTLDLTLIDFISKIDLDM